MRNPARPALPGGAASSPQARRTVAVSTAAPCESRLDHQTMLLLLLPYMSDMWLLLAALETAISPKLSLYTLQDGDQDFPAATSFSVICLHCLHCYTSRFMCGASTNRWLGRPPGDMLMSGFKKHSLGCGNDITPDAWSPDYSADQKIAAHV
ncbi:hypothetical protein NDU88_001395 [Pleurodeles waltl]|uniref:Uncharacterized protein n=1 Tax=Pleurodeles waltl TaxID=8319 RepID=A0AAV7S9T3_PLEWA|nr:hypothetical protein NDU88_001395 [Pleurodeles waltl]